MSLHIKRARCEIFYNEDLTGLQCKIIKMICKILIQCQSCQEGFAQKRLEEGHENVPLENFRFPGAEGTIILGDPGV